MEHRSSARSKGNKKSEIVRYIFEHKNASKTELTKELDFSMPTILQNTKELLEQGILKEAGEYESTGGRRAKSLTINGKAAYAVGLDITSDHISIVLLNLAGEILTHISKPKKFIGKLEYCMEVREELNAFIHSCQLEGEKVLGVGIAVPGVIDREGKVLIKSHALKLENVGLQMFAQMSTHKLHFENDANAAMIAESIYIEEDAIYLFLSNTVGGAFRTKGSLFYGNNRKTGEIGHVILVPGGRECECGKKGCVTAYCSAHALEAASGFSFEETMARVEARDPAVMPVWNEYLNYIAITVSNLRMMYDTDIILGGDVGACLEPYMLDLGTRVMALNTFDSDISYLHVSKYKKGGAAAGAALYFVRKFLDELC